MHIIGYLNQIRSAWIAEAANRLASDEQIRENFCRSLDRFYDALVLTVDSGDTNYIDPVLDEWVNSLMKTEMDLSTISLSPIINQLLLITYDIARKQLDDWSCAELLGALIPIHIHAFTYSTQVETNYQIQQISSELESAKLSLEQLDKNKSDFISIAAHELKTPLTLIEGYTSMMRDRLGDSVSDQLDIILKGIDNGTRRLREIVDDMIDVSLIDNDLLALNFQPVWIDQLLDLVQQEFSKIIQDRRLVFELKHFPGSHEMTFGDNERLFQAFCNLVTNAIKYTPDGGRIILDGRLLPGFVEITIADTGIGIDPNYHARIFEKFGRIGDVSLHSSGKTKFKGGGPGLGLPITKGIIEAHGGTIWAESEGFDEINCPGTIFHILLPIRKEAPDDKIARLFQTLKKAKIDGILPPD
jgi:signal transduction histidine kinase